MMIKLRYLILPVLSLLYANFAIASMVTTTYTGTVYGNDEAEGSVHVSFTYDSAMPTTFSAGATVGGFGDYAGNNFNLEFKANSYMYFTAPVVEGQTTIALHLYGIFTDNSPSNFTFDNRSSVTANSHGQPGFSVIIDNRSVVTNAIDIGPNPVPVPAVVWLFGSGLVGLVGMARRKKV